MRLPIFLLLVLISPLTEAFSWTDLWITKNQQAQKLMREKKYQAAENLFTDDNWRGIAAFRAKDFPKAASLFAGLDTELGYYNAGNALAASHAYERAIQAYEKALRLNPQNKMAMDNKKLIEELLKNQEAKKEKTKEKQSDNQQQTSQNDKQTTKNNSNNSQDKKQGKVDKKSDNKADNKQGNQKPQEMPEEKKEPAKAKSLQSVADREKQQTRDQLLRLVPDDPGGLLRAKFLRDYQRRYQGEYQ